MPGSAHVIGGHSAFARIDRPSGEAGNARKFIDHLHQAVLAKAFRGELVQQEPTSALLERIGAERPSKQRSKIRRASMIAGK